MNTLELKATRIAQGKDAFHMSDIIGKSYESYIKKEKGEVKFSSEEIAAITNDLCLSPAKFNNIFFDSKLLFGKF